MSASSVQERQNTAKALRAARAFRRRYTLAKRWNGLRFGVGIMLGTVGVVLVMFEHSVTDYLAATAAGWIVLSRTVIQAQERRALEEGALAHEVFDTEAFALPWNPAVAGVQPAPEDLRNWGERQSEGELRDWYADVTPARHPVDVLICQRSSVTWARQDHTTYARILRGTAVVLVIVTFVLAVVFKLSVSDYLLRLGLPILPATLDIIDIADSNEALGRKRARIAQEADRLYETARDAGDPPTIHDCRRLQDEIYTTRRMMGTPNWFYRFTQRRRQRNMSETAEEQVESLPASLRS